MSKKIKFNRSLARDTSVYTRWSWLVLLNAAFPFLLSFMVTHSSAQYIGIVLAILSFIVIYAEFDAYLIRQGYLRLSRQLRLSAIIKIATPLLPFIDMISGMIAIGATKLITGYNIESHSQITRYQASDTIHSPQASTLVELASTYIATMINGFILSAIVAILLLLVRLVYTLRKRHKQAKMTPANTRD